MKILHRLKYPVRGLINMMGAVLSVVAVVLLVYRAARQGSVWHIVSFAIYGTSLIALWTVSAI